jgi:membrane protease YdiL (CAAX protease family)
MFIENGFLPENKFWKYIVGSVLIILAATIGQIPLMVAIFVKSFSSGKHFPTDESEMMTFLEPNTTLFLILLSFVFAFFAIILVVRNFHKQTLLSVTTSREKVDWKRVFFSFGIWSVFTIVSTVIMYYSSPESFVVNFKPIPFLILAGIGILLIPIQTSTEEYVFRGYLMQGFGIGALQKKFLIGILYTFLFVLIYISIEILIEKLINSKSTINFFTSLTSLTKVLIFIFSILIIFFIDFILTKFNFFESNFYCNLYKKGKTKLVPLVMTSVIFGVMHIANPEVEKMGYIILVYYIGTGFFLGIITLMDEGMELALGFHAANNLVGALLITSDWSAFQTHSILKDNSLPSVGFEILVPIFIIFPILLYIFSKKYNWTNWQEKLTGTIEMNNENQIHKF